MQLRPGTVPFLRKIQRLVQIVIMCNLSKGKIQCLADYYEKMGCQIDAIYTIYKKKRSSLKFICYEQVFKDFGLLNTGMIQSRSMIIIPICLDCEEIKDRVDETVIFEKASRFNEKNFYCQGNPVSK